MFQNRLTLTTDLKNLGNLNQSTANQATETRSLFRVLAVLGFASIVLTAVLWLLQPEGAWWRVLLRTDLIVLAAIITASVLQYRRYNQVGLVIMLLGVSVGALLIMIDLPLALPPAVLLVFLMILGGYAVLPILVADLLASVNLVLITIVALFSPEAQLVFASSDESDAILGVLALLFMTIVAVIFGRWMIRVHRDTLQNRHQVFRFIIDNSSDMIFIKDRQSRILINNRFHAENVLGFASPMEAVGTTDFDVWEDRYAQEYYDVEQALMETRQESRNHEHCSVDPNGSTSWHNNDKLPIYHTDGEVVGLIGFAKEITAQKEVMQANARLQAVEREQKEALEDLFGQMQGIVTDLNDAASNILSSAVQQMAGVTEQNASVTQTAATVEEVRTTINQTAQRANQVSEVAKQALAVAHDGNEAMQDTVEGMNLIHARMADIVDAIHVLEERTGQISEIIVSVNDIADQSKLLALNAAIEAARAGKEGRGFAVVAMEVRQLAEQSQQATSRIADILREIEQQTNTVVLVTEEGSSVATNGVELVSTVGKTIEQLAGAVDESAQAATRIASSTMQQVSGMDQLTSAMDIIKAASAETAHSTRQTEDSAKHLNQVARMMESMISQHQD